MPELPEVQPSDVTEKPNKDAAKDAAIVSTPVVETSAAPWHDILGSLKGWKRFVPVQWVTDT
jgi:hypothetical protein